jgi:hypothetical protein
MTDREKPWKTLTTKAGDQLHWNEDTLQAEFAPKPCEAHASGTTCRECLPRLSELIRLAGECFDPQSPPRVDWLNGIQVGEYPPRCVLVKPTPSGGFETTREGFDVRYEGGVRMTASKRIPTGSPRRRPSNFPSSIVIFDHCVNVSITSSLLLRDFSVSLPDEMDADYREMLLDAVLDLSIDGELVVGDLALREALRLGRIPLAASSDVLLFGARKVDGEAPADGTPIGYMLPGGTMVRLVIRGVPLGGGLIRIDSLFEPGHYTARLPKRNQAPVPKKQA